MDLTLLPFVGLVAAAASTGIVFQPGQWYRTLDKPSWTPPDWAFGPIWTVLYLMIAAAGWLVHREAGVGVAVVVWVAQIAVNAAWSWLFFGRRRMKLALVDALAMIALSLLFMVLAWPVSKAAALLFVPYLAWVVIATALNREMMRLNPAYAV